MAFLSTSFPDAGEEPSLALRRSSAATAANADPRFLVRFRLDLFLPGSHADRTAGGRGRRDGALSPVPARADLQGPGLGHLAVQRLRSQGPPHVARPRTAVRRNRAAVPTSGAIPAIEPVAGAGGARGPQRKLGRGILPGGVPSRLRRGS